jgi:ferrous iron transport protein B
LTTTNCIAFIGNPNSGKTSLFNQLTGLNQKTSNTTGTTVEYKSAVVKLNQKNYVTLIDTPGTYSITGDSPDEQITNQIITGEVGQKPDLILYVADASNLKRNLLLFSQIATLEIPIILMLNMSDRAVRKGIKIDIDRLQKELGITVIETNARKNLDKQQILKSLSQVHFHCHYDFGKIEDSTEYRLQQIDKLLAKIEFTVSEDRRVTNKIDRWLVHPLYGFLLFVLLLFAMFQGVFTLAEYPMLWIENGFDVLSATIERIIQITWLKSLIINGIIAGLSGVLVFVPQIVILFFFITLMEDTGYMTRVSFIMDRIMRVFGLSGKSIIPLISGAACAIPAVMAARNIENWKNRMITIMVTPLMSCSARLPVYTLLISLTVPNDKVFGIISMQGLVLMGMYLLGLCASLVAALFFKWILRSRGGDTFIMELPDYRWPLFRNVASTCWVKAKSFVIQAGKIIVVVSIILWFLTNFRSDDHFYQVVPAQNIEESYAGTIGHLIEPAIAPLGYNWKIGIAILTSFAAREVFVGTINALYSHGTDGSMEMIKQAMLSELNPKTGEPLFSMATIFSLLIFYAFAMQCMSTLAVVYKETNSIKWPSIQFVYMSTLAYFLAWLTYSMMS